MNPGDVAAYLSSKGVTARSASNSNFHCSCWECGEDPHARGRLYFLDDGSDQAGLWNCFKCGAKGNLTTMRRHFGDSPIDEPQLQTNERHLELLAVATRYCAELLGDRDDVVHYLRHERGLTVDTIVKHQLGWCDGTLHLHLKQHGFTEQERVDSGLVRKDGKDFLTGRITIPYHINGNPVMLRGRAFGPSEQKYVTPSGYKTRLFNTDVTWDATTICVCEGEVDCLIAEQLGFAAVGVAGANTWQSSWNGYFTSAKRVHVLFDVDAAGTAGAEKVVRELGSKAKIVILPTGNDLSEWVHDFGGSREELEGLFLQFQTGSLKHPTKVRDDWVFFQKQSGLKLGYEYIDKAISPGLLDSQVFVLLARTNAGKTNFLLNVFQNVLANDPEAKILFFSLEQTEVEWYERARRIHRFYNLDADDDDVVRFYQDRFFIVDDNIVSLQQFRDAVDEFEDLTGGKPDLIGIDYLGYWARSFKGEAYQRTTDAIMALKAFAKERRVRIITPHQVNRSAQFGEEVALDAGRDGPVEETADFVAALWVPDDRQGKREEERTGEVLIKMLKSRHGGKGAQAQLRMARLSLALVPFNSPLSEQAKEEFFYALLQENWETAIWRHRTGIKTNSLARYTLPDGTLIDPSQIPGGER